MSNQDQPKFLNEWKQSALKDWGRILIMLSENDPEAASFFLQQSLEKFLKAYLLVNGWKLKKIHELDTLLNEACVQQPELEAFRDLCEEVSAFYIANRYPPLVRLEITCEEVISKCREAADLLQRLFPDEARSLILPE
ncbi:MAG: HEPN domain-containing protein [Candidatus Wallbacteria bacterium]|nr:HEPN domain-containing protein [Candidatus Wallbacteria bacterium]